MSSCLAGWCRRALLSGPVASVREPLVRYRELVSKRAKGEPVAYLVGHKEFMGLDFMVTSGVLIPNPDLSGIAVARTRTFIFGDGAGQNSRDPVTAGRGPWGASRSMIS